MSTAVVATAANARIERMVRDLERRLGSAVRPDPLNALRTGSSNTDTSCLIPDPRSPPSCWPYSRWPSWRAGHSAPRADAAGRVVAPANGATVTGRLRLAVDRPRGIRGSRSSSTGTCATSIRPHPSGTVPAVSWTGPRRLSNGRHRIAVRLRTSSRTVTHVRDINVRNGASRATDAVRDDRSAAAGRQVGAPAGATADHGSTSWRLVFRDDFDGPTVDPAWWAYDGPGHQGNGVRSPSAFTIKNGVLVVTAQMVAGRLVSGGLYHSLGLRYGRFDAGQHAFLGHHRVHLRLKATAELHQLHSIAHQLAQFPDRRRRDPRLRQTTQPQHVRQIGRVDHVVLDPTISPVQRLRVRQMHRRTQLLEQIHHPVPAIGRFDHHLRRISRIRDHRRDLTHLVRDSVSARRSPELLIRTITERRR